MTIEHTLSALCEALHVDVEGLKRAADDKDATIRDRVEYINALFDADTSVLEMLHYILKAAREPLWRVHCYCVDAAGTKRPLRVEPVLVRAPNPDAADDAACAVYFDERLRAAGCCWAPEIAPVEKHDAANRHEGTVRLI